MRDREGILTLTPDGKIRLDGVLMQVMPMLRENIFAHFSSGERVKVSFYDNGYVKSMVLVGGGEAPDISVENPENG